MAGGSDRYAGCLAFNALAALRAGADLVIVVAPRRAADIVAGYSPDLITVPCNTLFPEPRLVSEALENADSLVVGCGVSRTPDAHHAIARIVLDAKCPIVADAETLHVLAARPRLCKDKKMLLTPNAGEYRILAGKPWPSNSQERSRAAKSLALQYHSTVVVKGGLDYISDGDKVFIDQAGSQFLTKGGYGDLLAGVAGSVMARGHSALDAARVAALLVGRAGEEASKKFGEGTLASDTLKILPIVLSKILGRTSQ